MITIRAGIILLLLTAVASGQATAPAPTAGKPFILEGSGAKFIPWGFNYDRDFKMRLIEDYWESEWPTVESDFKEMKALGANVVRVHLQFGKFMEAAGKPNEKTLAQLAKLTKLAEETGLYLDLTGLACYRKADVPAWFDAMDEANRWAQQAVFWEAVAKACASSPAVFVYDLINEPVVPAQKVDTWLDPHELAGFSYVQFITKDIGTRKREDVARDWTRKMVAAIRKSDPGRMITIGMLPIVGSGFDPKVIAKEVSYISVHVYPNREKPNEAMDVVKQFSVGKPVVVEEMFPISCSSEDLTQFVRQSRGQVSGWIGFYWGKTPEELAASKEGVDVVSLGWLKMFQAMEDEVKKTE
jgi:hypothetical protein